LPQQTGGASRLSTIGARVAELAPGADSNLIEIIRGVANSGTTLSLPGALVLRAEEHSVELAASTPAAHAVTDLPLPKTQEAAILAPQLTRYRGNVG
jgi:hypothetical protein